MNINHQHSAHFFPIPTSHHHTHHQNHHLHRPIDSNLYFSTSSHGTNNQSIRLMDWENNITNNINNNINNTSRNTYSKIHAPTITNSNHPKTKNLRMQLQEIHMSYISNDECTFRSKLKDCLESRIQEYLSLTSHLQKFNFREIRDCLEMTIKKVGFDPQKTISAFEAIERYATNLLHYPWRHEYRSIFAFNGFFNRQIKCSLVGYEEIFELIGYNYDSMLDIYKLSDIPIDPDKMVQISFECLIAIVELRIMINVKSICSEMTWRDIYSIRSEHICNSENCVKIFNDLKRNNRLIDLDLDLADYSVKKFDNGLDFLSPVNTTPISNINNNNNNDLNQEIILPPPPSYLESDLDTIDFIDASIKPTESKNKIENDYDIIKKTNFPNYRINDDNYIENPTKFKNRKIIVAKNRTPVVLKSYKPYENGQQDSKTLSLTRNDEKLQNDKTMPTYAKIVRTKPRGFSPPKASTSSLSSSSTTLSLGMVKSNSSSSKWSCQSCTYANSDLVDVCLMCHRSRFKGNEIKPLTTGGRECNECTLVNDKNDNICNACGSSLADSPTYI